MRRQNYKVGAYVVLHLIQSAPPGSVFVVEADRQLDFRVLPDSSQWDIREYPPAIIGIHYGHPEH